MTAVTCADDALPLLAARLQEIMTPAELATLGTALQEMPAAGITFDDVMALARAIVEASSG